MRPDREYRDHLLSLDEPELIPTDGSLLAAAGCSCCGVWWSPDDYEWITRGCPIHDPLALVRPIADPPGMV